VGHERVQDEMEKKVQDGVRETDGEWYWESAAGERERERNV
jgi:hypothetical protein